MFLAEQKMGLVTQSKHRYRVNHFLSFLIFTKILHLLFFSEKNAQILAGPMVALALQDFEFAA